MGELLSKIAHGESEVLDFKFRIDDQKKIARTLVAFANSQGGSLLIGVKDNGKIAGTNPEEEFYMIQGAAELYCKPQVSFESKIWREGHHMDLEVSVPRSNVRHKTIDDNGKWRPFYRIEDRVVQSTKVLDRIWVYRAEQQSRPEKFSSEQLEILKFVQEEEPISISKLYRLTRRDRVEVDSIVATLVVWNVLSISLSEDGLRFGLSD